MKHKTHKKSHVLVVSLLLLFVLVISGTIAMLLDQTADVNNEFLPSEVTTSVIEDEFSGAIKENVKIKNTGDTEAYIRAEIIVTWQNEAGDIYGKKPDVGQDYAIDLTTDDSTSDGAKWILAQDGFFYWTSPVAPNEETGILITSCKPIANKAPAADYYLSVEIIGSGIQSVPDDAVEEAWATGIESVNDNKELTIKTQ